MSVIKKGTLKRGTAQISAQNEKGKAYAAREPIGEAVAADKPLAMCQASMGYRISANYQSVTLSASVTLPWDPDDVPAGLEAAAAYVDAFIEAHDADMRESLDWISRGQG